MRPRLEVRPLRPDEARRVVDYFHGLSDDDVERMGIVDRDRLPPPDTWERSLREALAVPDAQARAAYLAWLVDGEAVGFSSLKNVRRGDQGEMHLHIWSAGHRGKGHGTVLFCMAALAFYDRFALKRIVCEPRAANPMPNRVLQKAGFPLAKSYEASSSELSRVALLNQYVVERAVAEGYLARHGPAAEDAPAESAPAPLRPGVSATPRGLPPRHALEPTLRGRHVTLEPLREAHAAELWPAADEAGLWDHMTFDVRSPADLREWVRLRVAAREAGTAIPLLVRTADGQAVGSTSLFDLGPHGTMEVGHTWLGAAARRTAANTEAKRLLLAYAFESLGAIRVQLKCDERNERSRRAIERLGAAYEGTLRSQMVLAGGHRRNARVYSLLDSEWLAVRARLDAALSR